MLLYIQVGEGSRFDSPCGPPASRPPCMHGFEGKAFDDENTKKAESNITRDPAKAADPKMTFRDRGVEKRTNRRIERRMDRETEPEKRKTETQRD